MEKIDIGELGGQNRYIKGMGKSFFKKALPIGIGYFVRYGALVADWLDSRIMADVGEFKDVVFQFISK